MLDELEPLEVLVGRTFVRVTTDTMRPNVELVTFKEADGRVWALGHAADCCEKVYLEDITGDTKALTGTPIRTASLRAGFHPNGDTWGFVTIGTDKGAVVFRFFSYESYYNTDVELTCIRRPVVPQVTPFRGDSHD